MKQSTKIRFEFVSHWSTAHEHMHTHRMECIQFPYITYKYIVRPHKLAGFSNDAKNECEKRFASLRLALYVFFFLKRIPRYFSRVNKHQTTNWHLTIFLCFTCSFGWICSVFCVAFFFVSVWGFFFISSLLFIASSKKLFCMQPRSNNWSKTRWTFFCNEKKGEQKEKNWLHKLENRAKRYAASANLIVQGREREDASSFFLWYVNGSIGFFLLWSFV